jgi:hypothetical protein
MKRIKNDQRHGQDNRLLFKLQTNANPVPLEESGSEDTRSNRGDAVSNCGRHSTGPGSGGRRSITGRRRCWCAARRGAGRRGAAAAAADLSLGRVKGAALAHDLGRALALLLGVAGILGDAVLEGLFAEELWWLSVSRPRRNRTSSQRAHSGHRLDVVLKAGRSAVGAGAHELQVALRNCVS